MEIKTVWKIVVVTNSLIPFGTISISVNGWNPPFLVRRFKIWVSHQFFHKIILRYLIVITVSLVFVSQPVCIPIVVSGCFKKFLRLTSQFDHPLWVVHPHYDGNRRHLPPLQEDARMFCQEPLPTSSFRLDAGNERKQSKTLLFL